MGVVVEQTKALLTLCVDVIVENFDRFMYAHKSGNNELKYGFGLLQREKRISIQLLQKLLHTDEFHEYLNFLLNPYVKEIDLNFTVTDVMPILERLKQIAPTIISLDLPDSNYVNTPLPDIVSSLTNIESISLRGTNISIETFRCIGKNSQNLKSLAVYCEDATDGCIKALYSPNDSDNKSNLSEGLEYLYLPRNITTECLKYVLKHFRGLCHLDHEKVFDAVYMLHGNDACDSKISKIYKIQKLNIEYPENNLARFLKFCGKLIPHLKVLSIGFIHSQAYVDALKALPPLKEIMIYASESLNLSSYLEKKGSELETLAIIHGTISLNSLLNFCRKVKSLKLNSPTTIIDIPTSECSLQYCKNLQLSFEFAYDPNKHFAKCLLSRTPNLENMSFHDFSNDANRGLNTNFIQLITASAEWIRTLRRLCLIFNYVKLSTLKHFVENAPNLETIVLKKTNQLTVNDFEYLKRLKLSIIYIHWSNEYE